MYKFTIKNRRYIPHQSDYCGITLPNGVKCNYGFYWACVHLGILTIDD
ncbi:MAG: hypothetical protein IKE23_08480 [Exiguobacterium sp.]|nr:hypothetical protein [Exiguobacterium sp.]